MIRLSVEDYRGHYIIQCVLSESFPALTQFSAQRSASTIGYVLGEPVLMCFPLILNLLVQTYDYTCSLHDEVMHLF